MSFAASRIERECANRHYVFERHTRKKLKLPPSEYKEMIAANRTDCEDKCLNEFTFVCRSATYDSASKTCWLSRFTRRSHPELLEEDPSSDYLENTCLNGKRRCSRLWRVINDFAVRCRSSRGFPGQTNGETNSTIAYYSKVY